MGHFEIPVASMLVHIFFEWPPGILV